MTTFRMFLRGIRQWLRDGAPDRVSRRGTEPAPGPGHARGHRHLGPPPEQSRPRDAATTAGHDQPWVPTGGLVDRVRRSERRG